MSSKYLTEFGLEAEQAEQLLKTCEFEILGQIQNSSNATLLVQLNNSEHKAIYKPVKGERPLHDFPSGLHNRETAAYELSKLLGWDLVPPTVNVGEDSDELEHGPGSLQLFIDADFSEHYFTLLEEPTHHTELKRICLFDYLSNNTDRKSSHCLLGQAGIWAIDQGLCFHAQYKLRTVIWDFVGEPISDQDLDAISTTQDKLDVLKDYLDPFEISAMQSRFKALLDHKQFVEDETEGMRYPWPPI